MAMAQYETPKIFSMDQISIQTETTVLLHRSEDIMRCFEKHNICITPIILQQGSLSPNNRFKERI